MRTIGAVLIVLAFLLTAGQAGAERYSGDEKEQVCYAYETQWIPETRVVYVRGNAEGMALAKTLYENSLDHIEVSKGEPTNEYGNKVFLSGTGGKDFVLFSSDLRRELKAKQAQGQRITLDDDACREQRSTMKRIAGPVKKIQHEVKVRVPCRDKVVERDKTIGYDEFPQVVTPQRTYYAGSCPEMPALFALFFNGIVSSPCYSSVEFHRSYSKYYRYNDRYDRYHKKFRRFHPHYSYGYYKKPYKHDSVRYRPYYHRPSHHYREDYRSHRPQHNSYRNRY